MATFNLLKKYTCLELTVSFDGGKSPMFLHQNVKCCFDLEFGPEETTDHVLTMKSESKIALSFAVKVQVIAGESITTDPTKSFQGIGPFEIWRGDFGAYATMNHEFLIFRVMFAESSNIELIEDANVKTDKTHTSSLKKVTCLEWITRGDPRNMESRMFLIGDQMFYINFDKGGWPAAVYTLALDSDTNERLRFDAEFQVGWRSGEVTRGQKSLKGKPPYELWTNEVRNDLRDVLYFRVIFYNGLNIKVIEDGDAKTVKNSEISLRCLSSDIGKLLGNNASDLKSDVTVQCEDTTFSAHQIILATRSDVLRTMLQTNEAESGPRVLQIESESMKPSDCKIFLEYLYTATLPDLSVELAKVLYKAAEKYGVDSLKKQCSDFLGENFPDEDVQ